MVCRHNLGIGQWGSLTSRRIFKRNFWGWEYVGRIKLMQSMQFQLISFILCRVKVKFVMRNNYKIFVVKISINSWMTLFAGRLSSVTSEIILHSNWQSGVQHDLLEFHWRMHRMGEVEHHPFTDHRRIKHHEFPHVQTP